MWRFCRRIFCKLFVFRRVRKIAKSNYLASSCLFAWVNSDPTGRIFMKFHIWVFFENRLIKIQVSLKSYKNNGYFMYILIYLAHFFFEWEILQTKVAEEIRTRFSYLFCLKSFRLWDNMKKILLSRAGHRWPYGPFALHARYLRLQTHTHNM